MSSDDELRQVSDIDRAARILSRAIRYLISKQVEGRQISIGAAREAVALLQELARDVAQEVRSASVTESSASGLEGTAIFRNVPGRRTYLRKEYGP